LLRIAVAQALAGSLADLLDGGATTTHERDRRKQAETEHDECAHKGDHSGQKARPRANFSAGTTFEQQAGSQWQGWIVRTVWLPWVFGLGAAAAGCLVQPSQLDLGEGGSGAPMLTPVDTGDCNSCHTQDGKEGAPGRIILPW
jgi:hypothetical protein